MTHLQPGAAGAPDDLHQEPDEELDEGPATCSAKRCQAPATWQLLWNNPKLHTPDRRKVWLACDDHRQSLIDFLGKRGFLKDVVPHE